MFVPFPKEKGGGVTLLNIFPEHPRVTHQSGRPCLVLQPLTTLLLSVFLSADIFSHRLDLALPCRDRNHLMSTKVMCCRLNMVMREENKMDPMPGTVFQFRLVF